MLEGSLINKFTSIPNTILGKSINGKMDSLKGINLAVCFLLRGYTLNFIPGSKENLASAKPSGAGDRLKCADVLPKDGEMGPSRKYITKSYTF